MKLIQVTLNGTHCRNIRTPIKTSNTWYQSMDEVKMHQDWDEIDDDADFWSFWNDVQVFADCYNLSTRYVEEEFILDGELVAVHPRMEPTD